jgi:hypothetical protein
MSNARLEIALRREPVAFFSKFACLWLWGNGESSSNMGFRNYTHRAVLLLALALGVGIAVALLSGSERGRAVHGSSLPVIEGNADQRMAKPSTSTPRLSCPLPEGCARL